MRAPKRSFGPSITIANWRFFAIQDELARANRADLHVELSPAERRGAAITADRGRRRL